MSNYSLEDAIKYLRPVAESATVGGYGQMLTVVLDAAEKRAEWEAEQGEPEWEWAVESTYPYNVVHSGWTDEETAREIASWPITDGDRRLVRRRKAGPTLPVPDTTNHESEG